MTTAIEEKTTTSTGRRVGRPQGSTRPVVNVEAGQPAPIGKKCGHCKEYKTFDNFYNNKSRKDGLTPQCKVCHNKTTAKRRAPSRDNTRGKKRCPRCETWLPFEQYRNGGKSSYCRTCQIDYQRSNNQPKPSSVAEKRRVLREKLGEDFASYSWCSAGQHYEFKTGFNRNSTRRSGLESSCCACRNRYNQKPHMVEWRRYYYKGRRQAGAGLATQDD